MRTGRMTGEVYPRVCGGTQSSGSPSVNRKGLSPRVRGNPPTTGPRQHSSGSIPACAGEPCSRSRISWLSGVYPRVCGGTPDTTDCKRSMMGLSPRVRGNRAGPAGGSQYLRSIPACAGEPRALRAAVAAAQVYPRVCGGTIPPRLHARRPQGLSPRVRGNPTSAACSPSRFGSIPACAGEPRACRPRPSPTGVYPRVCGGTRASRLVTASTSGLSPRVRGNHSGAFKGILRRGSIPACAGEPSRQIATPARARVYPRVCGGTLTAGDWGLGLAGLSPRVRGNRAPVYAMPALEGSIPACAGEPLAAGAAP